MKVLQHIKEISSENPADSVPRNQGDIIQLHDSGTGQAQCKYSPLHILLSFHHRVISAEMAAGFLRPLTCPDIRPGIPHPVLFHKRGKIPFESHAARPECKLIFHPFL